MGNAQTQSEHAAPQELADVPAPSRYLDPAASLGELLFGLIMTLTFTLGARLAFGEEGDPRLLAVAVIGCNAAWGVIDGALYLLNIAFEQSRKARIIMAIKRAPNEAAARRIVKRHGEPMLEPFVDPPERERIYGHMHEKLSREEAPRLRLGVEEFRGAAACFVLVFLPCFPALVPFLLIDDSWIALRVSNLLLLGALFWTGWFWARHTNANRPLIGTLVAALGLVLVALAIALGG